MFDYDDTEADHLNEIYDGYDVREPLSREERADFVDAKSRCFQKSDIGNVFVTFVQKLFQPLPKHRHTIFIFERKYPNRRVVTPPPLASFPTPNNLFHR